MLRIDQQFVCESNCQLKLSCLEQARRTLSSSTFRAICLILLEIELRLVDSLPSLRDLSVLLQLLSFKLSLGGVIGHHDLTVKYWIVEDHLLVILHILFRGFDALVLRHAVEERSLEILLRKRTLIETNVLVQTCDFLWRGTGAESLQF